MKTSLPILIACYLGFAASSNAVIIITGPTVITQPGAYILLNDIVLPPATFGTNLVAINIQSSFVSIDFNGYSVIALGSGQTGVLASGDSFIRLQNGTITNFTNGKGIVVGGAGTTGIVIKNMTIVSANNGIQANGTSSACRITECQVSNCINGIETGGGFSVLQNVVSNCTGSAIYGVKGDFAARNTVSNSHYGIFVAGKYQDNLSSGCTVPFTPPLGSSGHDAGGNN